ncbi:hypothetical protein EXIGLDRAFT_760438 [Exidia glandulosa HHB12029]|uniref:Uncharacterized protein n=1 Tax=Exidia glandulosa HHB12029 TaxID=1314781 RepID=A0A165P9D6_EXIGL|nr:hypothetical protein EXIGLDRAFT_760438 [Exidia glandulosa HHB12029]
MNSAHTNTAKQRYALPCLLTIPPELRHDIIERVLLYERLPPRDVAAERANREFAPQYAPAESPWDIASWVFLERSVQPPNVDGLLCTNRQLMYETRAIIQRLNPEYKLDLLLVDKAQLWPTWTCLPVSAHFIDRVHVSIASIGESSRGSWLWSFRGPPTSMWALYGLLYSYLEHGLTPSDNDDEGQSRRPIVVRNITLDFIDLRVRDAPAGANLVTTADVRTFMATATSALPLQYPDYTAWRRRSASRRHRVVHNARIPAPWFARTVREFLHLLLQDVWSIRYSRVLHRRVGVINIAVRGDIVDTCDITAALALLDLDVPPDTYPSFTSRFLTHMIDVLETREDFGLPVPSETRLERYESELEVLNSCIDLRDDEIFFPSDEPIV